MKSLRLLLIVAAMASLQACKDNADNSSDTNNADTTATVPAPADIPVFNADSAYAYTAAQVAFGPRVPGSKSQKQCADWMQARLRSFCDTVYRQDVNVKGGDGKQLPCINLVGSIHPQATRRILLLAHWDSRPWADQDTKDKDKPIDAADDGASGVAVLLELARTLKTSALPDSLGIDVLLVDVEDYGKSEWGDDSYGLGTQYWAHNPHIAGYKAEGGILLDMVGARNASFPMEESSREYARDLQTQVWQSASRAGYSSYFTFASSGGGVTDDHTFVNQIAHIPTIDIIHLSTPNQGGFFPAHWHTHNDNMSVIDKNTLKAVGQTLLQFLFETSAAPQA